jgi:hypothetical protein
MQTIRALMPSNQLLWPAGLAIAGMLFLVMWSHPSAAPLFDSKCDNWDIDARAVLVSLISERSEVAEARASDALFRLKRARKYCRYGLTGMAQFDYDALLSKRYEIRH